MIKRKIKVFYDGGCKICSKEIKFYSGLDKNNKIEWINILTDNCNVLKNNISKKRLLEILHVQKTNGEIVTGVNAFYVIWRELKYFRVLSYFLKLRFFRIIAEIFYKVWLNLR